MVGSPDATVCAGSHDGRVRLLAAFTIAEYQGSRYGARGNIPWLSSRSYKRIQKKWLNKRTTLAHSRSANEHSAYEAIGPVPALADVLTRKNEGKDLSSMVYSIV